MKRTVIVTLLILLSCSLVFATGAKEEPGTAAATTYKEEVVIGVQSRTSSTNPTSQTSVAHKIMFNLTHNGFVGYDERTKEILPELATEWKASSDLKTWTFTLRDDVYFHNGEKLTADDVLFTWEYGKNASNATVKSFWNGVESVKAIDDYHVELVLKAANIDLLHLLSNEYFAILNREAVTADATKGPDIGTGPYVNKEFFSGDYTLLERFDRYWGEAPVTKTLRFRYLPEGTARLAALENGEIDVCQAPNNTELDIIKANSDLVLNTWQTTALTFLALNTEDPILSDPNLRLAIAYAIKVQDVIDGAASGFAGTANGMWGYFQYGFFDDWKSVGQSSYETNLATAKEYMAKSKSPNGATLKFTAASAWTVNALQIIQDQLKALNITVEIEQVDAAGLSRKSVSGDYQVIIYSVTFTSAGSDAARIFTPGNSVNYARYNNARVNELFSLGASETDDAKRKAYYKEIQTIVHAECPYIPLYYANSGVAHSKVAEGAVYNTSGSHDYTYIKVAK
ncbi:MAG: ABC transporter substrate-binding protein [Sphaerochaetaceae bacterium]|nr:ABC transporter substrate-binding protein [Methanomethylovorans sp.]MDX9809623.1 ABC transporter substrate-binding protein [Sphaerochaetaceae bacterium]NLV84268.1 ABC transporter substrate-binding protein [Spirochaetales bacterium]